MMDVLGKNKLDVASSGEVKTSWREKEELHFSCLSPVLLSSQLVFKFY